MKKSVVMAFALGALSMLSFNLFASDSGEVEVQLPPQSNIEMRNDNQNINNNTGVEDYTDYRNNCYNGSRMNNNLQGRTGRGCY
nr:hypothetical protein [uncultured Niameybacter sp.]